MMSEYEDRYPDAYGRREEIDPTPRKRHFLGLGLPRQVRDSAPAVTSAPGDAQPVPGEPPIKVVDIADLPPRPPRHPNRPQSERPHGERPSRPPVERPASEVCKGVAEQLAASPFIDATGISITADDGEVTLAGTINSLIAISLARALALGVPGVNRVQVQLRVQHAPRRYETADKVGA
jgi:hypothetical protein